MRAADPGRREGNARMKWVLCGLLFLATTLNYLDRQTLAILAPTIQKELSLDNADLGLLFSVFYWAYTLAQFAIGRFVDRSNLRWSYGLAVVAWSLVAALTGMAGTLIHLIIFRVMLGLAESPNWPAAMRIVALTLPPGQRPMGNGIFTSGTSVGALIAPAVILSVAAWWGWRSAFVAVGALGLLWFAVWITATQRVDLRPREAKTAIGRSAYREIFSSKSFWRVFAVTCLVNPCLYFNLNWLPTYFNQRYGVEQGAAMVGLLTVIYIGLDLGYLACGAAGIVLARRGLSVNKTRRVIFLAATILMAISAAVPAAASLRWALVLLTVVNFGTGVWISMYLTMAQEVSRQHISTAAGMLGGSGSLAGALAMWGVGQVTQSTGSFATPFVAVAAAAMLAAVAGIAVTRADQSQSC
jgi:ACS family hexuronate transporter-like MFS transporter